MYRLTTTAGLDQHIRTTPDALDALDALDTHLRDQLVGADTPVHIDGRSPNPTAPKCKAAPASPATTP